VLGLRPARGLPSPDRWLGGGLARARPQRPARELARARLSRDGEGRRGSATFSEQPDNQRVLLTALSLAQVSQRRTHRARRDDRRTRAMTDVQTTASCATDRRGAENEQNRSIPLDDFRVRARSRPALATSALVCGALFPRTRASTHESARGRLHAAFARAATSREHEIPHATQFA
jgi:hypothetical protein